MYYIDVFIGNIFIKVVIFFLWEGYFIIEISIFLLLGDSYCGFWVVGMELEILDLYNVWIVEG